LLNVAEREQANQANLKELQAQAKKAKNQVSDGNLDALLQAAVKTPAGYPVIVSRVDVADPGAMRNLWDVVRGRMEAPGAIVMIGVKNEKPILLAAGSDEAVASGFNAGSLIKSIAPLVAGGGGGKPTMAQAGGKDASGIDAALDKARAELGIA
jgi:alanyl-tRNA synthetase